MTVSMEHKRKTSWDSKTSTNFSIFSNLYSVSIALEYKQRLQCNESWYLWSNHLESNALEIKSPFNSLLLWCTVKVELTFTFRV
ncbi:Protein of unknown function [Cotesia congregata]|uniref:Uncharacterized protein n=1 Tax=Cotesia congregata TaxID=51543 RepID=A0A8J2MT84_COTCN|nr:Protein of unknown function [Cotesia congregata]